MWKLCRQVCCSDMHQTLMVLLNEHFKVPHKIVNYEFVIKFPTTPNSALIIPIVSGRIQQTPGQVWLDTAGMPFTRSLSARCEVQLGSGSLLVSPSCHRKKNKLKWI